MNFCPLILAAYWTVLSSQPYSDPSQNPTGATFNAELASLPVFRDCALVNQSSLRRAPNGRAAFRRLEENYVGGVDDPRWLSLAGNPKPDRPLFSYMVTKRDAAALVGPIDLDRGQYAEWKSAHTNFFSFRMLSEWGVDLTHLRQRAERVADPARRDELLREWCAPVPDRYAQMDIARRYVDRLVDLHYGDRDAFTAMHSFFALGHVAAAWGAKALMVETTNTTGPKMDKEYRWAVQGMFARGAARQFGVPWGWYVAVYFNGPRRDGSWMNNSTPSYSVRSATKFPEAGVSASLFNRVCHYAYLNGANAVEVESWPSHLLMRGEDGRDALSPRGKLFSAYHDFTRRHPDRGIPHTPVAVLAPFAQGYPATGGKSWATFDYTPGDYTLDAVFFTLQRGFDRPAAMRRGVEANLHNSPYPVMCDVLCPDSPQDPEAFFSVLTNYPVAILAGDYRDRSFEPVLNRYEAAGGRLLRITPEMLPPFGGSLPADVFSGRRTFPKLDSFFADVRDRLFPVKVDGDVLWGLNRTKRGWWVWCMNNKGVTKFADAFEEVDESAASRIRVDLGAAASARVRELLSERDVSVSGDDFEWTVPAGGVAVFEICEQEAAARGEFAIPAAECAKYWHAVTGSELPPGTIAFAIDPGVSKSGKDAYTIISGGVSDGTKPVPPAVTITGSNLRSVLYGVYDLFERRAGCRWFWDGDIVPQKRAIDLSGLDVHEEAAFEYRGIRYFAHRGLHRFQAEHWGMEDWKREIDWCLKRRLNVFMLRLGQDDLFQRTFPDAVPYPDASKPLRGAGVGYDNRTLFWPLEYRGRLRAAVQKYGRDRGMMIPEDFGTMTHWYSRTPEEFLEKRNPPFLPQATSGYAEKNGLVWDIRDRKWADEYWKLTRTAVDEYGGGKNELLHTIGLGERRCFTNRAENLNLKLQALDTFISRARRDYPESKILLAGWDFYFTWHPDEVKRLVATLDPAHTIIWDYEGDATRDYRPEMIGLGNNFTKWGVVGRFPYTYSMFLAYENALDIRANYRLVEERQRIVQNDPFCAGYIFWPEASHTDTLALRYFTANAWRKGGIQSCDVLAEFCESRYGEQSQQLKSVWEKVIPLSSTLDWGGNCIHATTCTFRKEGKSGWAEPVTPDNGDHWLRYESPKEIGAAADVLLALADVEWRSEFVRRDVFDLARTAADRGIIDLRQRMLRAYHGWRRGGVSADEVRRLAAAFAESGRLFADLLEQHEDYSMYESYMKLDATEKIRNPDFGSVLLDNASCSYCRSHQYEIVRKWAEPAMKWLADEVVARMSRGDRPFPKAPPLPPGVSMTERGGIAFSKTLAEMRPRTARTQANFRKTALALASALSTAKAPCAASADVVLENDDFRPISGSTECRLQLPGTAQRP